MAIQISTDPATGERTATFSLPDTLQQADTHISVVGSFNDWTPGIHVLAAGDDGQLAVSVPLTSDDDLHFRYLQTGGVWFDDPQADEQTPRGSVARVTSTMSSPATESTEDHLPADSAAASPTTSASQTKK
jgi:hypothetical protein